MRHLNSLDRVNTIVPYKNSLASLFERVGAQWNHWQEEEGREEENKKWSVHYGAVT